jgi:hypothetical protein
MNVESTATESVEGNIFKLLLPSATLIVRVVESESDKMTGNYELRRRHWPSHGRFISCFRSVIQA